MRVMPSTNVLFIGICWICTLPFVGCQVTRQGGLEVTTEEEKKEVVLTPQERMGKWDKMVVDYGQLSRAETRTTVFTFTNTSQEEVTIEICTACDCMTLDWTTLPIKPGAQGEVKAIFDAGKKDIGEEVNDHIVVVLGNRDPQSQAPIIYELNYRAQIVQ